METVGVRPVRIVEIVNPFQPDARAGEVLLAPIPGEYLVGAMLRAGLNAADFAIRLNGELINAGEEGFQTVKPGDEIVCAHAGAGGALRIVAMVALLAVTTALTGGLGDVVEAVMWTALGISTSAMAAVTAAAIAIGGNMLISAFLGPGGGGGQSAGLTYDPTGPKTLAQPGTPIPKGYGTMGWGGNIISSFVTQDGKDEYLNILVSFGFGPAANVQDIFLNQKPLSSYPDLSYHIRYGTNDQTTIPGFDTIENVYPQETELLAANPPTIVTGTGTNTSGLQVAVKFPGGLMRTDSGGSPKECSLAYQIKVAPSGTNLWQTPIFPRTTSDVYTTDANGYRHYPYWVVMPTDRFAGSGIVYSTDTDEGAHTPGEAWNETQTVTVYDVNNTSSSYSQTFSGEWQPTSNIQLDLESVTDWWSGWRIVSNMTDESFYDVVNIYGLTSGKWDVQVYKYGAGPHNQPIPAGDGYMTDPHYTADAWLWDVTEIQFADLAYPNFILLSINALATSQINGSSITVQATITHSLGADTVLPAALAGFEPDNPALVAYDIITNPLYGMASSTPNISVDVPAFVQWAEFCDELVPNSTFAGAWSSATNYTISKTVSYGGNYYVSLVDGNLNITPGTNSFYWQAAAGNGAVQRRFVFAGVFDVNGSNAWQCLQQVAQMSRAQITQDGNTYSVWIDAPTDITQIFTEANIKKGSYSETFISLDNRASLVEVEFADALRNWRTDLPVSVMTAATINSGIQPKITRVKQTPGCTNRDQAWQWAYFNLLSTETLTRTAKWQAALESVSCKRGSVVGVQRTKWSLGGRIQAGSTATNLIIDRTDLPAFTGSGWTVGVQHPVYAVGTATIQSIASAGNNSYLVTFTGNLPAGRILHLSGPGGIEATVQGVTQSGGANGNSLTMGSVQGAFAAGQVVTLFDYDRIETQAVSALNGLNLTTAAFSQAPTPDAPWFYALTPGGLAYKTFRVTGVKQISDFTMEISGLEYNSAIYVNPTPSYGEIVSYPTVNAGVTNLVLAERITAVTISSKNAYKKSTPQQTLISCSWDNGPNTLAIDVWGQVDGGAWNLLAGNASNAGYTFAASTGDVWSIRVVGKDALGVQSSYNDAPMQTITVQGTGAAPADVAGLTGNLQTGTLTLAWGAVSGCTYELRYNSDPNNSNWYTGAQIAFGLTSPTYTVTGPGDGLFMVKALSSTYIESVNSAGWALTTSSSPLNGVGSIAPGQSLEVDVATVTYDATSGLCSCELSMPAQNLLRTDGSTYVVAGGTMTWTKVLAPATTYYFYTDLRISDGTLHVAGGTSASGGDEPALPPTSPSAALALLACSDGYYQGPQISVTTPTTSGTGGGSSGGGPGVCPDGRELVDTLERGIVPVSTVIEGERILGYCFTAGEAIYRKVAAVRAAEAWSWYLVNGYRMSPIDPIWIAGEWRMPYQVGTFDGGPGERVQLTVEADEYEQHNYYLVGRDKGLLIHNARIAPC